MKKIPERIYNEMLEVLPPAIMRADAFLVGEPTTHNDKGEPVYGAYARVGKEFFVARNMTVREFKEWKPENDEDEGAAEQYEEEMRLVDEHGAEAVAAYLSLNIGKLEDFEEAFAGKFVNHEEFAQDMAEQLGSIDKSAVWPQTCIDWEYAARELMYDYSEEGGYYFRNL